jgi:hypothetical protein
LYLFNLPGLSSTPQCLIELHRIDEPITGKVICPRRSVLLGDGEHLTPQPINPAGLSINLAWDSINPAGLSINLTGRSINLPGRSINLSGGSINLAGKAINLPGNSINLAGSSTNRSGFQQTFQ